MESETQKQVGSIKRGWLLTLASWRILRQDARLLAFSFMNIFASLLVMGLFAAIGLAILYATGGDMQSLQTQYDNTGTLPGYAYPLIFLMFLPLFIVLNYFTACITGGALQQFKGSTPTIKSGFRAANRIAGNLVVFSFYEDVAIWSIDLLRKIRFIGDAMAFLGELGFAVGTFFALPIMIDRQGSVTPLGAIKESAELIRKTWGESIVVSLGMITWAVFAGVLYTVLWAAVLLAITPFVHPADTVTAKVYIEAVIVISPLVLGYGLIIMFYSALSAIATAALYVYATTGQVPTGFDGRLFEQSVRPKTSSDI